MQTMKKWIDLSIAFVTCTLLGVMVLMAIWQVFTRYALDSPSTISEEFLRYSLIWVSMLGGAYAFGNKKHIAIEFIVEKLENRKRLAAAILIELIVLAFAVFVMIVGGSKTVGISMEQYSAALGLPMAYIYLSLPVSGILIAAYTIISIRGISANRKADLYSEEVETPEPIHIDKDRKEGLG